MQAGCEAVTDPRTGVMLMCLCLLRPGGIDVALQCLDVGLIDVDEL